MKVTGRVSHFGGPADSGVSPSEPLAWWEIWADVVNDGAEHLFLPTQPNGTTGLARRLDPNQPYIAMRWSYDEPQQAKNDLASGRYWALVRATRTGREILCRPADWGPNSNTGRVADISPGAMAALGIETDDEVTVSYPRDDGRLPRPPVELPPAEVAIKPRVVVALTVPDTVELSVVINGQPLLTMGDED